MPSRKPVVLAVDVGTSSCRASVYAPSGARVRKKPVQASYQVRTTADGGAELDARELLDGVRGVIGGMLDATRDQEIVGVGTSTFWHSLLGLDDRGEPLTPLYLWLDARSRDQAQWLRERVDQSAVHARVGCTIHWSYWPSKLLWLRQTQPEAFSRVKRWVSFGEYLLEQLTGARGVSVSMASGTGLLDQHTLEWDAELLDVIGVEPERMSPIISLDSLSNEFRDPKLRGVRVLPAVGDGACSNLGAGCATPDRFALMVGTSGAERVVWAPERLQIPRGTWCYRVDDRRVVLGGALNDGGSLFDWLRRALRLPTLARAESELASLEPDGHGLTVLPFWGGERSPGWARDAQGAVVGLRLHTRPIDVLRAALEAIALRFGELDRALVEAMPTAGEVVATGAALLHSPAWMQIMADVLGRPVLASAELQGSSRGVALLALETFGWLDRPLAEHVPDVTARYEPVAKHTDRYRAAAERQGRLYDLLVQP